MTNKNEITVDRFVEIPEGNFSYGEYGWIRSFDAPDGTRVSISATRGAMTEAMKRVGVKELFSASRLDLYEKVDAELLIMHEQGWQPEGE